jgi:hypothetical protein
MSTYNGNNERIKRKFNFPENETRIARARHEPRVPILSKIQRSRISNSSGLVRLLNK